MSRLPGPDEQWLESTEGDLDPDLAEEGEYGDWEPPAQRGWWPLLTRLVIAVLILALIAPVVLSAMLR